MELLPIVVSGDSDIFDWCFVFGLYDRDCKVLGAVGGEDCTTVGVGLLGIVRVDVYYTIALD